MEMTDTKRTSFYKLVGMMEEEQKKTAVAGLEKHAERRAFYFCPVFSLLCFGLCDIIKTLKIGRRLSHEQPLDSSHGFFRPADRH